MSKKSSPALQLFGVALIAVAFIIFFRSAFRPRQIGAAGKPLDFWLAELRENDARSNAARKVFLDAGKSSVGFLTNQIILKPRLRNELIETKRRLPFTVAKRLPSAPLINWDSRISAAYMLGELGREASNAVPFLLKTLSSTDAEELIPTGPNAQFTTARSWHYHLRSAAINAIAKIDPANTNLPAAAAAMAFEHVDLLGPANAELYASGVRALSHIDSPNETNAAIILQIWREKEAAVSSQRLTRFALSAVPKIPPNSSYDILHSETNTVLALQSASPTDRAAAAFALGDPDREGWNRFKTPGLPKLKDGTIRALEKSLQDSSEKVRLNAAETVIRLGAQSDAAVDTLVGLLDTTNWLAQFRVIDALKLAGAKSSKALPKLKLATTNEAPFVALWAKKTVREIESDSAR
jgi:hypothetical protein